MPIRGRGSIRLPFLRIHWVRHGLLGLPHYSSHTWHWWRWSHNSDRRRDRIDLPGHDHWESPWKR